MAKNLLFVISALCVLALTIGSVRASYVQISSTITTPGPVPLSATSFNVTIKLTNSGDDTARSMFISAWTSAPGVNGVAVPAQDLGPNSSVTINYAFTVAGAAPAGTHALAIITSYQDANGVQFSSITPLTYSFGGATQSQIEIFPSTATIPQTSTGTLQEEVMNLGDSVQHAKVYLVLPREMSSGNSSIAEQDITLQPKTSVTVSFTVNSGGAIAPSTYQAGVFAVSQDGQTFSTAIGKPLINVVNGTSNYIYIVAGIILLVIAVLVYFQLKTKGKLI